MKKILINFVFYDSIGHVIEALKKAKGYYVANNNSEIHLLLNGNAPAEIVEGAPWIKKTYSVNLNEIVKRGNNANSLKRVPRNWDFILDDDRILKYPFAHYDNLRIFNSIGEETYKESLGLYVYHLIAKVYFKSIIARDSIWSNKSIKLKYKKNQKIIINF